MNRPFRPEVPVARPGLTQAAEGLPRRAFSVADVEAMVAAGIIPHDERIELIGGEIVPMAAKGAWHEWVKVVLNRHFQRACPDTLDVAPETTLRLDAYTYLEPDFCVFPRRPGPIKIDPATVALCVEVADSSLAYDLGLKIEIYAAYGIPEVWVIDARRLVTRVHRRLGDAGYAEVFEAAAGETVTPLAEPALAVSLASLDLTPADATDDDPDA